MAEHQCASNVAAEAEVCIPTTIAALHRFPGFRSPGVRIVLVGAVVQEQLGFVFRDITLDDSTGRIRVRHLHNLDTISDQPRLLGNYVTVAGRLSNTTPQHVVAGTVHPVASPDVVSCHFIEAAHTFLVLSRRAA
jgi:hypothetical protein